MHSGVALIAVDAQGENQILALPGANARGRRAAALRRRRVVLPGRDPARRAGGDARGGARRRRDRGRQPVAAERVRRRPRWRGFDIAIVNETELDAFAGHLPPRVVLTRGARGAVLLPEGTELPAVPAHAVDTTGAGDAFAGGLCAGLASGASLEEAVQLALVTAAISVERDGCQPSYARRDEVAERAAAAGIDRPPALSRPKTTKGPAAQAVRRRPLPPTPSSRWAQR